MQVFCKKRKPITISGKDESIEDVINKLTDEMLKYAANMEFEKAAELRDQIKELEKIK